MGWQAVLGAWVLSAPRTAPLGTTKWKSPAFWDWKEAQTNLPPHTHPVMFTPVGSPSPFQKVLPSLLPTLKEVSLTSQEGELWPGPSLGSSPPLLRKPPPSLTWAGQWGKPWLPGDLCVGWFSEGRRVKQSSISHWVRGAGLGVSCLLQCRRPSYTLPIAAPQVKATRIQVPSPLSFHLDGLALSLLVPVTGHL